jgi:hypothetical protein
MPEANPDTARLEDRLVLLLLVELPTLARAPEDKREDRLVPLIELIVLVVVDIFNPFYLFIFLSCRVYQSRLAVFTAKARTTHLRRPRIFTVSSNPTD